jgi:excisionase family DNA binding protein
MHDRLLDSRQIAVILCISRSYAYLLMRNGTLPTVRMGRVVRVRERDMDRYLQTVGPPPRERATREHRQP